MATWSVDKTTITNKGMMMLNASQSGLGAITVTRAVIGSTFSATDALAGLTAIPSPAGSPSIISRAYVDGGSVIRIELDNMGVTTAFPVCQVGIYATHPNIDGGAEYLYMISQCNLPADTLPTESTTYVRLRFKMYIQHSQSDSVTFVLDATTIPIASATELGGIMVGEGLSIDENGVLSGANEYELPIASSSVLGGIKVGEGLTVDVNGVLNAIGSVSYREIL